MSLKRSQPVEVNLDMGPLGKHWRTGYVFIEYEAPSARVPLQSAAPSCLVEHASGVFAGVAVRHFVSDVREVKS